MQAHGARPSRLGELDGLRGVLALYVAFFHLSNSFPELVRYLWEHAPIARHPGFAVDVFFVLSGLVMSYVYRGEFAGGVTFARYRAFFAARIARLYPVHLLLLLLLAAAVLLRALASGVPVQAGGRYGWGTGLASLLMLHGPWVGYLSWNYPAWSISAEFHAYALFPFAVRWLRGTRRALWVLGLGTAIPAALYSGLGTGEAGPVLPTNGAAVLLRALPLFAVGMACQALPALRWVRSRGAALAAALSLGATLWWGQPLAMLLWAPALVYFTLHNPDLGRVFRLRSLQRLGEISYSLYMVHAVVEILLLRPGLALARRLGAGDWIVAPGGAALLVACALGLSLIGALALLHFVERPLREAVRSALAPRVAAPPRDSAQAARRAG